MADEDAKLKPRVEDIERELKRKRMRDGPPPDSVATHDAIVAFGTRGMVRSSCPSSGASLNTSARSDCSLSVVHTMRSCYSLDVAAVARVSEAPMILVMVCVVGCRGK